ncbi:hypothetical protein [Streptomyces gardneri]|uniref:CBM2 domain-containing protein n=1 Tax=Streptomyces gardneri TaxID=66892 RepID=A0A4Y3RNQ4_9ACTN|nr:hypothetical protein [Streptomyces gardneri]GEB58387.1 hypothetical protein SGA01_39920 [Streptomyces gardneri]GHH03360.1 hypothetical protein GCM10017674_40880 [Streptomyces gardneri]
MRKNIMTAAGVTAAAVTLSLSMSGSAQAAPTALDAGSSNCSTTGAYGAMSWTNYWGPGYTINLKFTLTDKLADGNSVAVRLISKDTFGRIHNWKWNKNSQGNGRTSTWNTTASHVNGLFDIGIQVARLNSDGSVKNTCTKW